VGEGSSQSERGQARLSPLPVGGRFVEVVAPGFRLAQRREVCGGMCGELLGSLLLHRQRGHDREGPFTLPVLNPTARAKPERRSRHPGARNRS
jgi:hypothetical protein